MKLKTRITGIIIFFIVVCFPRLVSADNSNEFTATINFYNADGSLSDSIALKKSNDNKQMFIAEKTNLVINSEKIVIEGNLPDDNAEIKNVSGVFEQFESILSYDVKNNRELEKVGNNGYKITYDNISTPHIRGSFYLEVETADKERYILLLTTPEEDSIYGEKDGVFPLLESVILEDFKTGETLSERRGFVAGEKKYDYVTVEEEITSVNFRVYREQDSIEGFPGGTSGTHFNWLALGENYLSVNGEAMERFNVQSERFAENYTSSQLQLQSGLNLAATVYRVGYPRISLPRTGTAQDKDLSLVREYVTVYPYIIEYIGQEKDEVQKSFDASLAALDCFSWFKNNRDFIQYVSQVDKTGTKHKVIIPDNMQSENKILLGILTSESSASINVLGNEQKEGGYFEDDKDRIGFYYGICFDDITKISDAGNKIIEVEVTALDGKTTQTHEIEVLYLSSECDLLGMDVTGAEIEKFSDGLLAGATEYYMDVTANQKQITFENIEVSEGAAVKVDGKKVDLTDGITVNADEITKLVVEASDGVSSKTYLFLHRFGDRLPYFGISDETKKKAQEMLDVGWNGRSDEEVKNLLGDYWPIFRSAATGTNIDNGVVFDVTNKTFKQATDYGAVILQLVLMGENPYEYQDDKGNNLVEYLQENWTGPYANTIWALMGLKAAGTEIPDELLKQVTNLAEYKAYDPDMRGWALAAVADILPQKDVARLVESFRDLLVTSGDEAGMFYNFWYTYSNSESHGNVLQGMAGAGIDVEKQFSLEDGTTPLSALKKYQLDDGKFGYTLKDMGYNSFFKGVIIGLGDTVNESNVWQRCALTREKFDALLETAGGLIKNSDDKDLKRAYDAAAVAAAGIGKDAVAGLGESYYNLYVAVAAVNEESVDRPRNLRMLRSMDDNDKINLINETIEDSLDDIYANTKNIIEAKNAYDTLGQGQDEAYIERIRTSYLIGLEKLLEAHENLGLVADVIEVIEALSDPAVLSEEAQIEAALQKYQELQEEQRSAVYNIEKLNGIREAVERMLSVFQKIEDLPEADVLTLEKAVRTNIEEARNAYEDLAEEEQNQISNIDKLSAVEERLADLTAASPVIEQIDSIGEINQDNWEEKEAQVIIARNLYNMLTEVQRALVANIEVLEDAEISVAALKVDGDVAAAIAAIDVLRKTTDGSGNSINGPLKATENNGGSPDWEIWGSWTEYVANLRAQVNYIDANRRVGISNIQSLEAAENFISQLQTEDVFILLQELPASEDFTGEEAEVFSADQLAAIGRAEAAFDELSAAQQKAIRSADETLKVNLDALTAIIMEEADYIAIYQNAYLEGFWQELQALYGVLSAEPATMRDIGIAVKTLEKFQNIYASRQEELNNLAASDGYTLAEVIALLEIQIAQVDADVAEAQGLDAWIRSLTTAIDMNNMDAVEADIKAVEAAYEKLNDAAKSYVSAQGYLDTVKTVLQHYKDEIAAKIKAFQNGSPSLSTKATAYNTVKVSWKAYSEADSYIVYRKTSGGSWKNLSTVKALTYTDKTAVPKTTYYYTVKAVSSKWGQTVNSKYNTTGIKTVTNLSATTLKSAKSTNYKTVKLSWDKVAGASGYRIFRSTSKNGTYKHLKFVTKGSTVSYKDSKSLTAGKTYYYKIRAYRTVNNKRIYGAYSSIKSAKVKPATAKISKVSSAKKSVTVKFNKVNGATGYRIYRSTSKNGKYKLVKSVNSKTFSWKNTKLKSGKTYYYKVRAYRKVNGKNVYGSYSDAKKVKVK